MAMLDGLNDTRKIQAERRALAARVIYASTMFGFVFCINAPTPHVQHEGSRREAQYRGGWRRKAQGPCMLDDEKGASISPDRLKWRVRRAQIHWRKGFLRSYRLTPSYLAI